MPCFANTFQLILNWITLQRQDIQCSNNCIQLNLSWKRFANRCFYLCITQHPNFIGIGVCTYCIVSWLGQTKSDLVSCVICVLSWWLPVYWNALIIRNIITFYSDIRSFVFKMNVSSYVSNYILNNGLLNMTNNCRY